MTKEKNKTTSKYWTKQTAQGQLKKQNRKAVQNSNVNWLWNVLNSRSTVQFSAPWAHVRSARRSDEELITFILSAQADQKACFCLDSRSTLRAMLTALRAHRVVSN